MESQGSGTGQNNSGPNAPKRSSNPLLFLGGLGVSGRLRFHDRSVSSAIIFSPRPLDWPSWVQITGSWVLPNSDGDDWTPPKDLEEFIRKAREDGKPLVYCGFGSITVNDPNAMTNAVIESVHMAGVRLILSKGASDIEQPWSLSLTALTFFS